MISKRLALVAVLLAPGTAFAASDSGGVGSLVWHAFNLLLLVAIVIRFARRPVQSFFDERRRNIESGLDAARRQLDEAERKLARWKERLTELDRESAEVRERVRAQAEAEAEQILAKARAAAERIRHDAAAAVEQESRRAREALRQEAGALAAEVAGTLLRQEIDERDRGRLVDDFIGHVERTTRGDAGARD